MYITMLPTLRGSDVPALWEAIDVLVSKKVLAGRTFNKCFSHNKKGWLVHCAL